MQLCRWPMPGRSQSCRARASDRYLEIRQKTRPRRERARPFRAGLVGNEGFGDIIRTEGDLSSGPSWAAQQPCSFSILSLGGRFVGRLVFRDCVSEPCNRPLCFAATGFPPEDASDEKQEEQHHCDGEHCAEDLALRRTRPIQKILPIATLQLSPGILR